MTRAPFLQRFSYGWVATEFTEITEKASGPSVGSVFSVAKTLHAFENRCSKITTAQARDNLKSIAKIGSKALKEEASKTEYQNAYRLNDNEGGNNTEVDNSLQEWPN